MQILIDNGHGADTPGKRSPDGLLLEYDYTRRIAREIARRLDNDVTIITPETRDIPLKERISRVNTISNRVGASNALLISLHVNAAGNGSQWHNASGWMAITAPTASKASAYLAGILQRHAIAAGLTGNRAIPAEGFWRQNLAICLLTQCPAVLTENLFQDCRHDVDFLLSDTGFETIVNIHINAITEYLNSL